MVRLVLVLVLFTGCASSNSLERKRSAVKVEVIPEFCGPVFLFEGSSDSYCVK
jgi:hypothetical protein